MVEKEELQIQVIQEEENLSDYEGERFMSIGVPKETYTGERRVSIVPAHIRKLVKFLIKIIFFLKFFFLISN